MSERFRFGKSKLRQSLKPDIDTLRLPFSELTITLVMTGEAVSVYIIILVTDNLGRNIYWGFRFTQGALQTTTTSRAGAYTEEMT